MSDLRRLGSDDPVARALFEAARSYRPPLRARRATMRMLGVPMGLSLLGSALAQVAQAAAPFKGWIAAGVLTAVSAGGGALYLTERLAAPERPALVEARTPASAPRGPAERSPAAPPPLAAVAALPAPTLPPPLVAVAALPAPTTPPLPPPDPARPRRIAVRTPLPESPRLAPASPAPESPPSEERAPRPEVPVAPTTPPAGAPGWSAAPRPEVAVAPPAPPSRALAWSAPVAPRSGLDAELALVERARLQLAESPRWALATLDEYEHAFPQGALGEEAEVLRLSALAAAGREAEAKARASTFLTIHPRSPLAARARSFLPPSPSKERLP
jgi:hypothetical protein